MIPPRKHSCTACSKGLTFSVTVSNACPVSSQPDHTPYSLYALFFISSPCHLQMMPPALLCGAHELLLGTAVSLPHCPLVLVPCVPGARPSSAAEEVISFSPSLWRCPWVSMADCFCQAAGSSLNHRFTKSWKGLSWRGLERSPPCYSPAMGMVSNHQIRLPSIPSNLALDSSTGGVSTTSLSNLFERLSTLRVKSSSQLLTQISPLLV